MVASPLGSCKIRSNTVGRLTTPDVLESGRQNLIPNHAMKTQFRKALIPAEIGSLVRFDHKVFSPADWFDRDDWKTYENWWMIIDNRKVGCCAFKRHVDFEDDLRHDGENPTRRGSLYICSTGILPTFRRRGFGSLLKCWQISYARNHNFDRIVTNTRESNKAMIALNKKFGFKVLRTTPGYYGAPWEPTIVMELLIDAIRT
jgi:ribosomal protein S18 acetylase RimI-like enzyme